MTHYTRNNQVSKTIFRTLNTINRQVVGIICLSLILRLIAIGTREIIYDDAFTILLSERNLGQIIRGTAADTMPPLFYFILHFWMAVAQGLVWVRLLNVVIAVSNIYILFAWIKVISSNEESALFAALLMTISPWHIYHAQDIRMYALFTLWLSGYAYFTSAAYLLPGKQNIKNCIGIVITGAGALYTHNLAIFTLLVPNLYFLMKKNWQALKHLVIMQFVFGLLFLPWLVRLPGQLEKIQTAFWTPTPGLAEVMQSVIYLTGSLPLPKLALGVVLFLTLLIIGYIAYEAKTVIREIPNSNLLILFIIIPPLFMFVLSYLLRPIFVPRGFIFSSVSFYGLCGLILWKLKSKLKKVAIIFMFIASATISLLYQIPYDEFPRSPYREGISYLRQNARDGTIIIHDNKLSYLPMYYYDREINQVYITDEPGTFNDTLAPETQQVLGVHPIKSIKEVSGRNIDLFFIFFKRAVIEYQNAGVQNPNLTWLEGNCLYYNSARMNDLWIQHYVCKG